MQITYLQITKKKKIYKKIKFHPIYNYIFEKLFNEFRITLAVANKFDIKTLIQS